jgi:eukaryotic-like serine/threonine-protein kinase
VAREFFKQKPEDPLRKRLLAATYSGLGSVQLNSLETDKAVESLRTALGVLGTDPNGSEDHDRALVLLYGPMGYALNELGSHAEAIASYKRAIAIAEDLAQRFPSKRARRNLYTLYNNIALVSAGRDTLNAGQTEQGQIYARKAVTAAEELLASDTTNVQARSDLAYTYTAMGDSLASRRPSDAREWYRKAVAVTKELGPRSYAPRELAERHQTLAAVLVTKEQAPERLHLLQEANAIRQEIVKTTPNSPRERVHLMRSYCRLSDAELEMNHVANAIRHAELSVPFFNEFKVTSPSLVVLRDLGFCYESLGNAHRAAARNRSFSRLERSAAEAQAHQWYLKSLDAWKEWVRRGAATPDSETERRKVERLLQRK